jgi:hypothetical protein
MGIRTFLFVSLVLLLSSYRSGNVFWKEKDLEGYKLYFTATDEKELEEYISFCETGVAQTKAFFDQSFQNKFSIYIHPNRKTLDSTWQKDWGMPDFKSQCWMVASGVAGKMDLISPRIWNKEACEHSYSDKEKNNSPDFSDVDKLDWFVEGLATYASGQCDEQRLREVKRAALEKKVPVALDQFWTGNLKYGLSGSMVMYIDKKYGRQKLKELLKFNKGKDILMQLEASEQVLIEGWLDFLKTV